MWIRPDAHEKNPRSYCVNSTFALGITIGLEKDKGETPYRKSGVYPHVRNCVVLNTLLAAAAVELVLDVLVSTFLWTLPARPRGGFCCMGNTASP
jgi:hypothetical protein